MRSTPILAGCLTLIAAAMVAAGCLENSGGALDAGARADGGSSGGDRDGGGGSGGSGTGGEGPGPVDGGPPVGDDPGPFLTGVKKGVLWRISLAATGRDTEIGQVKLADGTPLPKLLAIARADGKLMGIDFERKTNSTLVVIDETTLVASAAPVDFKGVPGKPGLGYQSSSDGKFVWGSSQFGPTFRVNLDDGGVDVFNTRQANSDSDPTQCHTPEDVVASGDDVFFFGGCFGLPDAGVQGAIGWRAIPPTYRDKEIRFYQRVGGDNSGGFNGVSFAHGKYWATTSNNGLWVAETTDFTRVRAMTVSPDDLE